MTKPNLGYVVVIKFYERPYERYVNKVNYRRIISSKIKKKIAIKTKSLPGL